MSTYKTAVIVLMSILILHTPPAFAWYDFGHEAVATIAWNKLNPSTKDRVMALLAKNPYYSKWVAAGKGCS